MQVKTVALYEYFDLEKPADGAGWLDCYVQQNAVDGIRRPAVLILPGGGYGHVSPREGEPVALRF